MKIKGEPNDIPKHRKAGNKKKPFRAEYCWDSIRNSKGEVLYTTSWKECGQGYETEAQRDQAVKDMNKKSKSFRYRIPPKDTE